MKKNFFDFNKIIIILFLLAFLINRFNKNIYQNQNNINKERTIGIISYYNDNNIGNQLLKYSMYNLLKRYGFKPILISLNSSNINIEFLQKNLYLKEINNYYTDLNESDFDFLIVNSDQVWAYNFGGILEIGFLSFAKNWNITKIVYAASLGYEFWTNSSKIINQCKELIKQFSGISVREYQSIEIIQNYFGIKPQFVLDPTLLLDKSDYLEIIKDFPSDFDLKKNYICTYILDESKIIQEYIQNVSKQYNLIIIPIKVGIKNFIEKFILSINICKSIITDSYHGTLFSIIFNKPFITFINTKRGNVRFFSLNQTFHLNNRFIYPKKFEKKEYDLLMKAPNIDQIKLKLLKERSIKFLKDNLGIKR